MASARETCPACQAAQIHSLAGSSRIAQVDYFMCDVCHHVWNLPKHTDGPIQHVSDPFESAARARRLSDVAS